MNNILIISNGHGEDLIAATLATALRNENKSVTIDAFPLVGAGIHYKKSTINIIQKNKAFPSGGFIRSIKDLFIDIANGLLSHIRQQKKQIAGIAKNYDLIIAVGDIFCLYMASKSHKKAIFLPTAKSDAFMPHSFIERYLIKRWASKSYTRDKLTSSSLKSYNINAEYLGNPMMDNLKSNKKIINKLPKDKIIGILPGSREEAYKNFTFISEICDLIQKDCNYHCRFACAASPHLDVKRLAKESNMQLRTDEQGQLLSTLSCQILVTQEFLAVINQADIIIGLSGTANEQAIELGKTVICFEGFGPQSTLKRFYEQKKLMQNKLIVLSVRNKALIAKTIASSLNENQASPAYTTQENAATKIAKSILQL